jgi:hypothetical protein
MNILTKVFQESSNFRWRGLLEELSDSFGGDFDGRKAILRRGEWTIIIGSCISSAVMAGNNAIHAQIYSVYSAKDLFSFAIRRKAAVLGHLSRIGKKDMGTTLDPGFARMFSIRTNAHKKVGEFLADDKIRYLMKAQPEYARLSVENGARFGSGSGRLSARIKAWGPSHTPDLQSLQYMVEMTFEMLERLRQIGSAQGIKS